MTTVDETELIADLPELHALQEIDLRVGVLLEQREELDDGSYKRAELQRARDRLEQINQNLAEFRHRQAERRIERDRLTERRERNQHRLWNETPTPAEAEVLQHDLQATATRLDQIEIELKDLEARIEPLEGQAEDEARTAAELESELAEVVAQFAEEVRDIDAELSTLTAAREAQARKVHPALLERYERIRRRRGDPGVVRVTDDVCGACHTQLTSYMMRQLHLAQTVQQCENCNTILYWAGEMRPIFTAEELEEGTTEEEFETED